VEVLLTRVTVFELLLGKMLGILRVGLLIYTGAGFLGYIIAQFAGFAHILSAQNILFYTLFFVVGYGLYAAFYLSIGSACANPKDAENMAMPVRFVLMTPVIASVYVNLHPTAPLAGFFAYFPLTAPFVMTNRMLVTEIPIWSLCGSLVLVAGCAGAGLWVAARILQASISTHGRALSLREIWNSITSSSARRIASDAS
jgi:ABC-2 type transport system permease protein